MTKTKRFVLDANILISALMLAPSTASAKAYYKAKDEGEIVISDDTFNEFSEVFIRPKFDKYLSLNKRISIIEDLRTMLLFINVEHHVDICRDPKDNKYLELAMSSNATCIVSGDKDLLVLNPFENIPIVS